MAQQSEEPPRGAPPEPTRTTPTGLRAVPLGVFAGAVAAGIVAASLAFAVMNARRPAPAPIQDSASAPDGALDFQWSSSRMDAGDCLGTFELTGGPATPAHLVASVMDSAGGIIATDSTQVASTVRGLRVQFRFRRASCDRISDWQMQVMTPKASAK